MRTTLKRAQGRSAAADGNGRAMLPPDALSPMRRYRQPEPPRRTGVRLVGRIALYLASTTVMLAVALVGGVYLWLHESVAAVAAHSEDVKAAQEVLDDVPPADKAAIALVIGYDRRHGEAEGTPSRSDTVMLLRADPQTKSVSMLSFPRDMVVDIHCPGGSVFRSRINAAYATCGAKGTLETVRELTGLPINYLIAVNFRGFKKIVNTLDGVWVDVDRRYFNDRGGSCLGCYAKINIQPGYQRLTGGAALDFVRFRHTDSDFHRVARQQLFVTAMKEQFHNSFSLTKVPKLVGAITQNVEVGQGGGKKISAKTVLRYALFAYGLPAGHFFQPRIGGLTGYAELTTDSASVQEAVQEFTNPDIEAPKVATAVALGRKLRSPAPKPADTTVTVLNGTTRAGAAGNARFLLQQRGYATLDWTNGATGNAPTADYFHSQVYYDAGQKGGRVAAKQVARLFGAASVESFTLQAKCTGAPIEQPRSCLVRPLSNDAMLTVVVGQTFHDSLAPNPARVELKRQRPSVRFDRGAFEPLLRQAKKDVPFKLMVPAVLDSASSVDSEMPIRVYGIADGHKAVRLVFRRGLEYWGVQETDWEDAPVLSSRNFRRVLKGRAYDLYYRGPKLHMIVLRRGESSYWVVNTLLDSLSNETMIAIAKGLQPLDVPKKKPKKKGQKQKGKQA